MKSFYTHFSKYVGLLLLALLTCNSAWADSVTYVPKDQNYTNAASVSSWTSEPVTIAFADGGNNNDPSYYTTGTALRMYASNTMTVSVAEGYYITSIAVDINGLKGYGLILPGETEGTTEEGTYTYTPTGTETTSVVYTVHSEKKDNTSSQARIAQVVVNYAQSGTTPTPGKTTGTLSFAETSYSVVLGNEFTAPTPTTNNESGVITYESSATDVATVDNTGAVTILAAGSTTITATLAEDENYTGATAFYTLTVTEPETPVTPGSEKVAFLETFGSISSAADIDKATGYTATADMFTNGKVASNYSGSANVQKNNAANLSSGYTDASGLSKLRHQASTGTNTVTYFQVQNINIAGLTNLQLSYGIFFENGDASKNNNILQISYSIDGGEAVSLSDAEFTKSWALQTRSISGTGNRLTITFTHVTTGGYTIHMDDIKVTGKASAVTPSEDVEVTFNADGYCTLYYGDRDLQLPEGVEAYIYAIGTTTDDVAELTATKMFSTDDTDCEAMTDIIPAGYPVVLYSTNGATTATLTTTTEGVWEASELDKDFTNDLRGKDEAGVNDDESIYPCILAYWTPTDGEATLGFWRVSNTYELAAHKAYLAMPASMSSVRGFALELGGTATAITTAPTAAAANQSVYNLAGQRVARATKGVYIQGGKKVIK